MSLNVWITRKVLLILKITKTTLDVYSGSIDIYPLDNIFNIFVIFLSSIHCSFLHFLSSSFFLYFIISIHFRVNSIWECNVKNEYAKWAIHIIFLLYSYMVNYKESNFLMPKPEQWTLTYIYIYMTTQLTHKKYFKHYCIILNDFKLTLYWEMFCLLFGQPYKIKRKK